MLAHRRSAGGQQDYDRSCKFGRIEIRQNRPERETVLRRLGLTKQREMLEYARTGSTGLYTRESEVRIAGTRVECRLDNKNRSSRALSLITDNASTSLFYLVLVV